MLSSGQKNQTKTVTYAEKQQLLKKLEELTQALEKQKQITGIQEKRLLSRRQKLDEARNQLNITRSAVNKLDTQVSSRNISIFIPHFTGSCGPAFTWNDFCND